MTDQNQNIDPKKGFTKETTIGIYLMVCQNVTPHIVGYLCQHAPILKEATWFQITVAALATIGGALVKFTPHCIWDVIAELIMYFRIGNKKIDDALDKPLPEDNQKETPK